MKRKKARYGITRETHIGTKRLSLPTFYQMK